MTFAKKLALSVSLVGLAHTSVHAADHPPTQSSPPAAEAAAEAKTHRPERLKIAYIVDSFDGTKSGAVVSANRFLRAIKEHHDVTLITTGKKEEEGRINAKSFYIPFARKKMKENGMVFGRMRKRQLRKILKDQDLVYVHFPFLLGTRAVSVARKLGKPIVTGFHVQPENMLRSASWLNRPSMVRRLYKRFIKKFHNRCDVTICPSAFAERLLVDNEYWDPTQTDTVVISNGLDDRFKPTPHEPFPELKDKFVVLSVGRLSAEKRHDVIIEAIKASRYEKEIQLVITGSGPIKDQLVRDTRDLTNPARIGFVSNEDLLRYYNTANLYIHASEVELEGMAVLEAIGCGMPALIANAPESASSQFAINPDYLFEGGNVAELAEKINRAYEMRGKELQEVGDAYAHKADEYRFEASVDKMLGAFYQAWDKHHHP